MEDVGGGRARKRGLQEFNLDEFLLATYYRRGSRETLARTSLERPSALARATSIPPRKRTFWSRDAGIG